ncbi:hypothetical protein [Streptomyces sp. NPDC093676]|uniref:hypothetical protein n=1 Tax=Streptomyces sp. NPDC093676 TaxID=3366050 RepID=UPI00382BE3CB
MDDGSKTNTTGSSAEEPESWWVRLLRRLREWRLHQYAARGMAYGLGSGAVSLLILWIQSR